MLTNITLSTLVLAFIVAISNFVGIPTVDLAAGIALFLVISTRLSLFLLKSRVDLHSIHFKINENEILNKLIKGDNND